jgi:hypothetical protein
VFMKFMKRNSLLVGLLAVLTVVACSKSSSSDDPDFPLPKVTHKADQCPNGNFALDFQGEQMTLSFTKTSEGVVWEDVGGQGSSMVIDGKVRVSKTGNKSYVAGCESGGVRMFLKEGRRLRHIIIMPSGDGFNIDTDWNGEPVSGHGKTVSLVDEPDPSLPTVQHVANQCPVGDITVELKGDRDQLSFVKIDNGVRWNVSSDKEAPIIDGRAHRLANGNPYIGACLNGGIKVFAKVGKKIRHSFISPSGDGYNLDSNGDGEQINVHLKKVN